MRFISFLIIFTTSFLYSQISNVRQTTENGRIIITYNLIGYIGGIYNIKVAATNEDGKTIEPRGIVGDIHEVKIGNERSIWWETSIDGVTQLGWKISLTSEVPIFKGPIGINWVFVQGGSRGDFYISATEITFDQFDSFCEATGYDKPSDNFGRGQQPVVNVNVTDAVAFCKWLSKKTGTTVRLPEEYEWEYAAIGGNKSKGHKYSGSNDIREVAWYDRNSGGKTHEVAMKKANELGIYDMSGNVWEWCGTAGAIRGGSWKNFERECSCLDRVGDHPDHRDSCHGFRVLQEK